MSQTDMRIVPSWLFEVPNDEMLLILKALGGRLVTEEQVAAAKTLGDRLTLHRAKELERAVAQLREAVR